ncbi:MAG: DUF1571 domain-containing protein [Gemmataceae bacterium]|nr:DUF1571 domain-containing protein [Gemmataceae bacterium]MCI0741190.1 DUF1571 domain-containing protein [Gemmataceae bacterium]
MAPRYLAVSWRVCGLALMACTSLFWIEQQSSGQGQPPMPKETSAGSGPLDEPMAWMLEARRNYTAVKDYSCTLIKKERVKGALSEDHVISFKFRDQPFSVYMRWLAPGHIGGQEVAFVAGRNRNKMRVQSKGLLKVVGFQSIDVNDPRVLEHSRHTILEAGIGNLIEQTIKLWEKEKLLNKTQVKVGEYTYNNRRCLRIEFTRPERHSDYYCYRSVLFLDKDSKLPIRTENYDWPRPGGNPGGDLIESYSFVDLRFNVGFRDSDFER